MRDIRFRAWDKVNNKMLSHKDMLDGSWDNWPTLFFAITDNDIYIPMQFTGLKDKNGLTEIYEGDIIDENGLVKGNVYESPQVFREGIDCVVKGMGTAEWRGAESIAMGRGCNYTK